MMPYIGLKSRSQEIMSSHCLISQSSISKVMDFKRTCPRVPSFLQKLRHSTLLLLSSIYYLGKGVDKDYSKAKCLFQQASAQGHNHALEFLLKVEKKETDGMESMD